LWTGDTPDAPAKTNSEDEETWLGGTKNANLTEKDLYPEV